MKASMTSVLISTINILILYAKIARCCGGYELIIDYIKNCDSDNIIELSDKFSVVLKPNCEVHFNGCITWHANITSSIIDYTVQKDLIKKSGKRDGCQQLDNIKPSSDIEMGLDILGLPKRCPINKGTVCLGIKSINVSKYKLLMNVLAGHLKGKSLMTTNAGKSCMEFSAKLVNALVKVMGHGLIG
ncbi:uncharacterized protein LOC113549850 [Rhopalosiphum maidis]|uniref:uncharacterized protein LOC113549850 n=1 Tax=Rhopalosiphum maidis TaxID=43146 RepID=UPI000F00E0BD|nr:uncharacterized protein LOC113549850 [Rhopalosiphum maidis]